MPPGPPNLGDNRFASLASGDHPPKRKKTSTNSFAFSYDLPVVNLPNPKFVVVSSDASSDKKLSDFSVFAIHRALMLISKNIEKISQLRDGNLLLLVKDNATASKFLTTNQLPTLCNIKCTLHNSLNYVKGTIYAPYLANVSNDEIVTELKSQGVVSVYKFSRIIDGKTKYTGVILLTFDLYRLPEKLNICWHKVKVREFYPNPMRCKTCQLLGHTAKRCENPPACVNCALPPHTPDECTRTFCANCSEPHSAASRECTKYAQQKEILKIQTQNKCTLREAKNIHRSTTTTNLQISSKSYAEIIKPKNKTQIIKTPNSADNGKTLSSRQQETPTKKDFSKNSKTETNINTEYKNTAQHKNNKNNTKAVSPHKTNIKTTTTTNKSTINQFDFTTTITPNTNKHNSNEASCSNSCTPASATDTSRKHTRRQLLREAIAKDDDYEDMDL